MQEGQGVRILLAHRRSETLSPTPGSVRFFVLRGTLRGKIKFAVPWGVGRTVLVCLSWSALEGIS